MWLCYVRTRVLVKESGRGSSLEANDDDEKCVKGLKGLNASGRLERGRWKVVVFEVVCGG